MPRPGSIPLPSIYDYSDYRRWLKKSLVALSHHDRRFSQRWVAMRAGFKSPHLLSMITAGERNLSDDRIRPLARVLNLSEREEEFLTLLVRMAHADTKELRTDLNRRIRNGFKNGLFSELSDQGMEIFRSWYLPALRELTEITSFDGSAAMAAASLGISLEQAQEGLALLIERGFLEQSEVGRWRRTEPSCHSMNKVSPMLLGQFHVQMLEKSCSAISLPRERRYFEALTMAVPTSLLPEIRERIQRTFREIDALVEASPQRDEVYQLNMQLFPLTPQKTEEDS